MTRFMLAAAAAAAIAVPASANTSNVYLQGSSVHVRYDDLNLGSREGRSRLEGRIHEGARLLCSDSSDDGFPGSIRRTECNRVMIASGIDQMNKIVRR